MAIVLAIEPDRRQAAHLIAIARHLVDAELVLADTTEGALDAIGNRVPDLVLVPALLSPQDDAALAAALRVIAAAAHVRTLTIPVLASGTKRKPVGGMLAKWRRSRTESPEPDGCEPAVFGEQISAYLKEAAAERAEFEGDPFEEEPIAAVQSIQAAPALPIPADSFPHNDTAAPPADPVFEESEPAAIIAVQPAAAVEPPVAPSPAEPLWADAREPWAADPPALSAEPLWASSREPWTVEPPALPAEPLWAGAREPLTAEPPALPAEPLWAGAREPLTAEPLALPAEPLWAADENDDTTGEESLIDLSDDLADLSEDEDAGQLFDGERVGVYTISAELEEPPIEAFDLLPRVLEPAALTADAMADLAEDAADTPIALVAATVDAAPEAPFDESSWVEPVPVEPVFVESMLVEALAGEPAAVDPPESPSADIEPWVPMFLTPGRIWPALEGMPAEVPVARSEQPDWIELVASLRQDLERRRTDPASAPAEPMAARPSDGSEAESRRLVKKQKPPAKKSRPVQDEWGFFDPEQCGFSTLLAKLDEITEDLSGA